MALSDNDIRALLQLLAEPELERAQTIIAHVASMPAEDLKRIGELSRGSPAAVLNNLEAAQARARYLLLDRQWLDVAQARSFDLEKTLVLVAEAELGEDGLHDYVKRRLDDFAARVGAKLSGDRAYDNGLAAIADILGGEAGLRGNRDDYYNAANSYLPVVLERGLGIPISLCSIAILVGQRLDLPVYGIGAPGHFLGFYGDPTLQQGSLFDPFDGFAKISRAGAEKLVRESSDQFDARSLLPVNEREIAARTMRNLIALHRQHGDLEAAERLRRWLEILVKHGNVP